MTATALAYFGLVNEADNDLWVHLFSGRQILSEGRVPMEDTFSYTAAGQPWVNHEWLTQVAMAWIYGHAGSAGLVLAKLSLLLVVLGCLWRGLSRRGLAPWVRGAVALLSLAVLARGLSFRPQLVSYAALAGLLALVDTSGDGRARRLWLLPPLFLLWVNLHGGFVLGLAVLGAFAFWRATVSERRDAHPLLVLGACGAAVSANPYGWRLLGYLRDELTRPHPITEWQPVVLEGEHGPFLLMGALLLLTLPFLRSWRSDGWRALLALALGVVAARQQRHTPVFALVAALPLAVQLEGVARRMGARGLHLGIGAQRLLAAGVLGIALIQCVFLGLRLRRDGMAIVFDPRDYPTRLVSALERGTARGNLAVPLDWGGYVLWHLAPPIRPSIDGRFATLYSPGLVEANFALFSGAPGWRTLLDAYATQAVLAPAGSPCPVGKEPDWRRVYSDEVASLFVRSGFEDEFRPGSPLAVQGRFP